MQRKRLFPPAMAGFALLAALSGAPAFAQQPAPAPQEKRVPLSPPSATHLAAARDLVLSSGMRRSFTALMPDIMRQLNGTLTRTRPELINDTKAILDRLEPEFGKTADQMVEQAALVYTALMTEQECKDAAAFFKSPSGVKYVDMQPSVFANISPIMEAWSKQLSTYMFQRVTDELKKKGHQL